ncbi:MAG: methyltransferase domain-containing protein [Nitrospiraceae bacterium]
MSDYIFSDHPDARELRRLQLIERALDATSITWLERTGLAAGQSALEIGAGAGSLVEWFAARVGSQGRVVALDKKTVHLDRFRRGPNAAVTVLEGNLADVAMPTPFDVAHARYVFIHNREASALLRRVRSMLKPGGWFVCEEPDFRCAAVLQPDSDSALDRVHQAIGAMFVQGGLDPSYGLRLPQQMQEAGFDIVQVESRLHLAPGGGPIAEVMGESALALRAAYTKTGLATDADIDHYVARARDPQRWAVWYATVSVLARVGAH